MMMMLMVRSHGKPEGLFNTLRAELQILDREQPLLLPLTLHIFTEFQLGQPRFNMALFSWLAGIALALATAGIYSVLSYSVEQRTREIGVRMALGATGSDVLRLVLGSGIRLLAVGLAIGLASSIALAKILQSEVFTVPLLDPLAFTTAAVLLSVVALLACCVPARRAS
jgi:putative ABC transport system permease protein